MHTRPDPSKPSLRADRDDHRKDPRTPLRDTPTRPVAALRGPVLLLVFVSTVSVDQQRARQRGEPGQKLLIEFDRMLHRPRFNEAEPVHPVPVGYQVR